MCDKPVAWDILEAFRLPGISRALDSRDWADNGGARSWPFFGMMAMLADNLSELALAKKRGHERSHTVAQWNTWLKTFDWRPPARLRATLRALLARRASDVGRRAACSPERIMVAAAAAGVMGSPRGVAGGIRLASAHIRKCKAARGITALFAPGWASVWRGLDRLTSLRAVHVEAGCCWGTSPDSDRHLSFHMSLPPPHIKGYLHFETNFVFLGDRIRAWRRNRCKPVFKTLLERIVETRGLQDLTVFDVGAHMGDCCLWAAARFGRYGLKCTAFERSAGLARVIRRSVDLNGFEGAVEVRRGSVGGAKDLCPPLAELDVTTNPVPLDCHLFERGRAIDFVHIHVSFQGELNLVEGLLRSLRHGLVGACLVRATEFSLEDFKDFVAKHELPYRVEFARVRYDVLLLRRGG